jgi:hypothetical protein
LGDNGEYSSFCLARLQSIEEIQNAQKDIEHDGINEWFYDNGVFEWKVCNNCTQGDWDWIRSKDEKKKKAGKYRHIKEDCVAYQEGGLGCPDCYCDLTCQNDGCHICGGNTPERIDNQIGWMDKMSKERLFELATKIAKEHEPVFLKLRTEELEKDKHPPDCIWHKDWHACDCGIFDGQQE